ncbi:hypothetical protein XAP6164_1490020 [Xanthomonas phaseoli pv. phaseoli]|nr:hypothetical protein XAP6164_1490020 [Xanthomonas phaseoli pv. phaseoli]
MHETRNRELRILSTQLIANRARLQAGDLSYLLDRERWWIQRREIFDCRKAAVVVLRDMSR